MKEPPPKFTLQPWASAAFKISMWLTAVTYLLCGVGFVHPPLIPLIKWPVLVIYLFALLALAIAGLFLAVGLSVDFSRITKVLARQLDDRAARMRKVALEMAGAASRVDLELSLRAVRLEIKLRERTKQRVAVIAAIGTGLIAVASALPANPLATSLSETLKYSVPAALLGGAIAIGYIHGFIDRLICVEDLLNSVLDSSQFSFGAGHSPVAS